MKSISVKNFAIGLKEPLAIMSGPCVIESESHCLFAASALKKMFAKHKINFIFKSSYDKANRSSLHSFRGLGIEEGLRILEKIKRELDLPIMTDIHTPAEAVVCAEVCDILQIPAFLCRQTDLLVAAGRTGKVVNVKKGQFMAPWDMANVAHKICSTGNQKVILVERGTTFGYNYLVNDFRGLSIMQDLGFPVCFDATHSVQKPGGKGESSGGDREFIPLLARAAIAAGVNCLFIEAHPDPKHAYSDADSVLDFADFPRLLTKLEKLYTIMLEDE